MQQLEKIMDSTNKNGTLIKKTLDDIKKDNVAYTDKEGVSSSSDGTRARDSHAGAGARRQRCCCCCWRCRLVGKQMQWSAHGLWQTGCYSTAPAHWLSR